MAELVLVSNPRRRRRKNSSRKGRMPAALKAYWATHRRGRKPRRRRSSERLANPRRHRRRVSNPSHRRRRRNPSARMGRFTAAIMPTVKAGGWGAAGALGLDVLWGLLYPRLGTFATYLANPYVGFIAKAAGAVAVGTLGGKVLRGRGRELAVGAMTVVTHDFLKSTLQGLAPTIFGTGGALPLGMYLHGSAPIVGTATIPQTYLPFNGGGMGMYLHGNAATQGEAGVYVDDTMGQDPWQAVR